MTNILKFFIFSSFFGLFSAKEIFEKTPTKIFKNTSQCIDHDFFYSSNVKVKRNVFQVIARMDFTRLNGVSMFNAYFKNNLAIVIPTREQLININCYSANRTVRKNTYLDFAFKYYGCNQIIKFAGRFNKYENLACDSNQDLRFIVLLFHTVDDYLVLWGILQINSTYIDLAAWILFKNNSYFAGTTQELENHLKKFLRNFNEHENIKLAEEDFQVNNITNNIKECDASFKEKETYGMGKPKLEIANAKSLITILIFGAVIFLIIVTAIYFIVKNVIGYVRRVRLSLMNNKLILMHSLLIALKSWSHSSYINQFNETFVKFLTFHKILLLHLSPFLEKIT